MIELLQMLNSLRMEIRAASAQRNAAVSHGGNDEHTATQLRAAADSAANEALNLARYKEGT